LGDEHGCADDDDVRPLGRPPLHAVPRLADAAPGRQLEARPAFPVPPAQGAAETEFGAARLRGAGVSPQEEFRPADLQVAGPRRPAGTSGGTDRPLFFPRRHRAAGAAGETDVVPLQPAVL